MRQVRRRQNIYLMLVPGKSTIGSEQPVHIRRVIPPIVNLLLKRMVVAALEVKFQQTTWY